MTGIEAMPSDELLDSAQVAELFGVGIDTVYRWRKGDGRIRLPEPTTTVKTAAGRLVAKWNMADILAADSTWELSGGNGAMLYSGDHSKLLTLEQVAELLGVSPRTVYMWQWGARVSISMPRPVAFLKSGGKFAPHWRESDIRDADAAGMFSQTGASLIGAKRAKDKRSRVAKDGMIGGMRDTAAVATVCQTTEWNIRAWVNQGVFPVPPVVHNRRMLWPLHMFDDLVNQMGSLSVKAAMARAANVSAATWSRWVRDGQGPQPCLWIGTGEAGCPRIDYWDAGALNWAKQQPGSLAFPYRYATPRPVRPVVVEDVDTSVKEVPGVKFSHSE